MTSLTKKLSLSFLAATAALCLAFGLFAVPVKSASAATVGTAQLDKAEYFNIDGSGVLWGLSAKGEALVEEYSSFAVVLPETVTEISANAFNGVSKKLAGLDMSPAENLAKIGANAFSSGITTSAKTPLKEITIPKSVQSIGAQAFAGHQDLSVINFNAQSCADFVSGDSNPFYRAGLQGDGVTVNIGSADVTVQYIPANMFYISGAYSHNVKVVNFVNADIAAGKFGANAFTSGNALQTVNFAPEGSNNNIEEIGESAFKGCASLTSVEIPSSVKTIGKNAFQSSSVSTLVLSNNGALDTIGESAFSGSRITKVTVPVGVTTLGKSAFNGCTALETVNFAEGIQLEAIGESAFNGCAALTNISIPASVKTVSSSAFYNCSALQAITVPAGVTSIGSNAFGGCTAVKDIYYLAENLNNNASTLSASPFANGGNATLHIGGSGSEVTYLPSYLFKNTKITSVIFENVVIRDIADFGKEVFASCANLTEVNFNDQVIKVIGESAFSSCTSLINVALPEQVNPNNQLNTIGVSAFNGCNSLYSITIPAGVSTISSGAFNSCNKLVEVFNKSNLTITAGATDNGAVARYAKNVYTASQGESNIVTENEGGFVVYDDGVNAYIISYIGNESKLDLSNINLKNNENGNRTFEISDKAFSNNTVIESIKLGKVSKIGLGAFSGCTSLKNITVPASVSQVGDSAFEGCTSLENAVLEDNSSSFSNVSNYMFKGCTSLKSVDISCAVSNIGMSAFEGCTALTNVKFNPYKTGPLKGTYNLKKIEGSAFKDCNNLKVIEIPASVTSVGQNAFKGCTSLSTVYLPVSSTYGSDAFENNANLLLISSSANAYNSDLSKLSAYNGKLTYIVVVQLKYGSDDTVTDTVNKLFNRSGNYVQEADKSWTLANDGMPVQEGYVKSVWYLTAVVEANDSFVTVDMLTAKLKEANVSKIELYAITTVKPKFERKADENIQFDYNVNENYGLSVEDLLIRLFKQDGKDINYSEFSKRFTVKVTGYTDYSGSTTTSNIVIKNAGTYNLEVCLSDAYGAWKQNIPLSFTINPEEVDITGFVSWKVNVGNGQYSDLSGDENDPVTLYFYDNIPYTYDPYKDGSKDPSDKPIRVARSYVVYDGRSTTEIVLVINDNEQNRFGRILESTYIDNKQQASGTYNASVTIETSNNYRFYMRDTGSSMLGLGFVQNTNGTVTISKTWYIAISNANTLTASSTSNAGFAIDGWNYSSSATAANDKLVTPGLAHGNAAEYVKFELWFTEDFESDSDDRQPITITKQTLTETNYKHYVNNSMPAGNYVLVFYIENYTDVSDGNKLYAGTGSNGLQYAFTVSTARVADLVLGNTPLGGNYDSALRGQEYKFEADGEVHFADETAMAVFDKNLTVHPVRRGVWNEATYKDYYAPFTITYNLVKEKGNNSSSVNGDTNYYTEEEYVNGTMPVRPVEAGKYLVYYQISAPSYDPLVDMTNENAEANRKAAYYTLILTVTLPGPTVEEGAVKFENHAMMTEIAALLRNDYYDIYFIDSASKNTPAQLLQYNSGRYDDYVKAGTHCVFLKIKSEYADYVVWDTVRTSPTYTETTPNGLIGTFAIIRFEIGRANNATGDTALYMRSWVWGDDVSDIRPEWSTVYGNDSKTFTYELRSVENPTEVYYYYGDGTVPEEGKRFADASAGNYTLKAIAPGGDDYDWNAWEDSAPFTIIKARLGWETTPYIESWKYGEFNKNSFAAPAAEDNILEAFKKLEINTYYCYASDYNKENINKFDIIELANKNAGQVPAGSYMLVFEAEETVNYYGWSYPVSFSVIKAFNYWETTPTVNDWVYGDYSDNVRGVDVKYVPHFGEASNVTLEYRKVDIETNAQLTSWCNSIEKLGLDEEGELPFGKYEFRATLLGNENYETLPFTMYFNVFKAQNSWKENELPGIRGWSEGNYSSDVNKLIGGARFGTVQFKVTDEKGNEYELDKLNKLGVGAYILTATVEGNDNYETLVNSVYFHVVEDSVGMTGLIAATIVFAVIATGLAVAAIVLLVRRNKKLEAEFRKAVRAELRRRK